MKILINNKINKIDLDIANKIFFEKKKLNYKYKSVNWNYPKSKQFIIYLKKNSSIIGMVRVIRRKVFLYNKFFNVACLTSIGILPNFRNFGYGKILMKKTNEYLKKKFDVSILIARKKVDFFYSKFNFIGNSEFYSIYLSFKNKDKKKEKKIEFYASKRKQITNNLKKFYISSNNKKNGYFHRTKHDWKIINNKICQKKFIIKEFNYKNISIGYIVFKKNCVYEYGYNIKYLIQFIYIIKANFRKEIEIKNPDQKIIDELKKNNEINIKKRLCTYGGHMINVNQENSLKNIYYNINYFDEF